MKIGIISLQATCEKYLKPVQEIINSNQSEFQIEIISTDVKSDYDLDDGVYSWAYLGESLGDIKTNKYDYIFGILSNPIENNWFSRPDHKNKSGFITTYLWNRYSADIPVETFIAIEIIELIFEFLMGPDNFIAHDSPRGCINDMCGDKQDMNFKIRTGYICPECTEIWLGNGIKQSTIKAAIICLENIRRIALKREDVHIKLNRTNADDIKELFPYPIAFNFLRFLNETDPFTKFRTAIGDKGAISLSIELLTIILLKNCEDVKKLDLFCDDGNKKKFKGINLIRHPTINSWLDLLKKILSHPDNYFIDTNLPATFRKIINNNEKQLRAWAKLRNTDKKQQDIRWYLEVLESGQLDKVTDVLYDFTTLWKRYNLIVAPELQFDGGVYITTTKILHGDTHSFSSKKIEFTEPPNTNEIILLDTQTTICISLKPWLRYNSKSQQLSIYYGQEAGGDFFNYSSYPTQLPGDLIQVSKKDLPGLPF